MGLDLRNATIATVVDDREPYVDEVVDLFASVERFGGALRDAARRVYFVDDASPQTEGRLRDLGVDVRVAPEVVPDFRFANKLAMFDGGARDGTELLIALDSDIIVAGDPAPYLHPGLVQAKQPDGDLLPLEFWHRIFQHFGLELPPERHATTIRPHWTHAYFNTGVIVVPGEALRPLHDRWLHFVRALIDVVPTWPDLMEHMGSVVPHYEGATADDLRPLFYAEQWGFSLALRELRLPYAVLPLALNFPTIYEDDQRPGEYIRERFAPHAVDPLLLHHHHKRDPALRPTGYAAPDRTIERVNRALFSGAPSRA